VSLQPRAPHPGQVGASGFGTLVDRHDGTIPATAALVEYLEPVMTAWCMSN